MKLFQLFFISLFLLIFAACSGSSGDDRYNDNNNNKNNDNIITDNDNSITIIKEDFDILPYKDELDIPELPDVSYVENDHISTNNFNTSELWYTYGDDKSIEDRKVISKEPGFRIQVFTGEELTEAEAVQSELFFKTKQKSIYIDFEPPVFKVKFGDFVDVGSAKDMDFRLKQLGFKNTVIVSDSVNVFR